MLKKIFIFILLTLILFKTFSKTENSNDFDYERKLPSYALHNFEDTMMVWMGPHNNPNEEHSLRSMGIAKLINLKDSNLSGFSNNTISLFLEGESDQQYLLPNQFDGHPEMIAKTGEFKTHLTSYEHKKLKFRNKPLEISRSFYLPPHEKFVLSEVKITNPSKTETMKGKLLEVANTERLNCGQKQYSFYNKEKVYSLMSDMTKCGNPLYVGFGFIEGKGYKVNSFQFGPINGEESAISQFIQKQKLKYRTVYEDYQVQIGIVYDFEVKPQQTLSIYSYSVVQKGWNEATDVIQRLLSKKPIEWINYTAQQYKSFLSKSKKPNLTEKQQIFYENSLITMKLGQNPINKAIVASFHPGYGYKVWSRDAIFAGMIMDGAGYYQINKDFLKFMSNVELRNDGGFHTTYSWFDGKVVPFVEPQFDSVGAYLLSAYYHYSLTKDEQLLYSIKNRINDCENFFLRNTEPFGLTPPGYSIWEESSDGITGQPVQTSHFAFTQGVSYAGIYSAYLIEKLVFKDEQRANLLLKRSESLCQGIENHLWNDQIGQYVRSLSQQQQQDTRADSASNSIIWGGCATNQQRMKSHIDNMKKKLTKNGYGIARYENDPFFFDSKYNPGGREVGERSPPWPVMTLEMAWAEMTTLKDKSKWEDIVNKRLEWTRGVAAPYQMPIGEAVDGVSGKFVMSSAPDLYEHAGIWLWTVLMSQGLAKIPNPKNL